MCARGSASAALWSREGHASPFPGRLPVGSQQDVPGQEVFPAEQRETPSSEGPLGDLFVFSCQDPKPRPPGAEAAGRGAGGTVLGHSRSHTHGLSTVCEHRGCSPAWEADPRGPGCRDSKKRGPYVEAPFTLSPALCPSLWLLCWTFQGCSSNLHSTMPILQMRRLRLRCKCHPAFPASPSSA